MYSSFIDMPVWNEAFDLSIEVFNLSSGLPRSEDYGLTSQIRRAATSVAANLSEGFGRQTSADKSHFYVMARGSAYETQNHLLYGNKVGYFESEAEQQLFSKYTSLIHSLNKLIKALSQPQSQPQPQKI